MVEHRPETNQDRARSDPAGHRAPVATRWSVWAVAVPVAALLLGFVAGFALTRPDVTSRSGDDPETSGTAPSTAAEPAEPAVVVPEACVRAAGAVEEATSILRQGVAALRDLRTGELRDQLNELEDLEARARDQAAACTAVDVVTSSGRSAASPDLEPATTPSATAPPRDEQVPTASPDSSPRPRRSR